MRTLSRATLGLVAVIACLLLSTGTALAAPESPPPAEPLQSTTDQCSKPVEQRVGPWACPNLGPRKHPRPTLADMSGEEGTANRSPGYETEFCMWAQGNQCWRKADSLTVDWDGEVNVGKGPNTFDTALIVIRWYSQGPTVHYGPATWIDLMWPNTTNQVNFFSTLWQGNDLDEGYPVDTAQSSVTGQTSDASWFRPSSYSVLDVSGPFIAQWGETRFAQLQISFNIPNQSGFWNFQVRSPLMYADADDPWEEDNPLLHFQDMDDLPPEPLDYGWSY